MGYTRIGVFGATGKMGSAIIRAIGTTPGALLAAAIEREGHPAIGQDAGVVVSGVSRGVPITAGPPANKTDVWIDFSVPAATLAAVKAAQAMNVAMVVGTTGLSADDREQLRAAAKQIPIVFSPNMSVGVNVMLKLVADAARALGPSYDLEIVETHHRAKRDAPSGTALRLAEALAEATGRNLGATARYERHGEIGARTADSVAAGTEKSIQTSVLLVGVPAVIGTPRLTPETTTPASWPIAGWPSRSTAAASNAPGVVPIARMIALPIFPVAPKTPIRV